jgi:hypothetical protein
VSTLPAFPSDGAPALKPGPADGTNLAKCASGNCEVSVRAGDMIPVPASTQVQSIRVASIDQEVVTITGRDLGHEHSVICLTFCTVSAGSDEFKIELRRAGEAYENRLHIMLVSRTADTAVLRLAETPERSTDPGNAVTWNWPSFLALLGTSPRPGS